MSESHIFHLAATSTAHLKVDASLTHVPTLCHQQLFYLSSLPVTVHPSTPFFFACEKKGDLLILHI